jgi:hypothetical protein
LKKPGTNWNINSPDVILVEMFKASTMFEANDNFSGDPFMGTPFRIF